MPEASKPNSMASLKSLSVRAEKSHAILSSSANSSPASSIYSPHVFFLAHLDSVTPVPSEACDISEWGTAAETEAQWCHPVKISEPSARGMLLTSRNIVPHHTRCSGTSFEYYPIGGTYAAALKRVRERE